MTNYRNTGEGNTNGNTVTTADSTADGSVAWDAVSIVTGGTLVYDNTHPLNSGTVTYKVATGATSGVAYAAWTTGITYAKPFFASACFYFTANPGATFRLMSVLTGATTQGQLSIGTGGKFQAFDSAATGAGLNFTNAIPLNQWFRVEFEIVAFSLTVAQYEIRLFNDPYSTTPTETQTSAASFNTGSTSTPTQIRFGHAGSNTASQAAFWMAQCQVNTVSYPPPATYTSTGSGAVSLTAAATTNSGSTGTAALSLTGAATVTLKYTATGSAALTLTGAAQPLYFNSANLGTNGNAVSLAASGIGSDGSLLFDVGSTGTGSSIIYDNTHVAEGTLAYKFTASASAGVFAGWTSAQFTTGSLIYGSMLLYLPSLPPRTMAIVSVLNGSFSNQLDLEITTAGNLRVSPSGASGFTTSSTTLPTGQYVRVEWAVLATSATVGQLEARIFTNPYGTVPDETVTSAASLNVPTGNPSRLTVGLLNTLSSGTYSAWVDQIRFSTTGYPAPYVPPSTSTTGTGALTLAAAATSNVPNVVTAAGTITLTGAAASQQATTGSAVLSLTAQASRNLVGHVKTIDSKTAQSASVLTLTAPSAVTAGNAIIVACEASLTDNCTVTDDAGNVYTQDASAANSTTIGLRIFSAVNVAGLTTGQHITVTWSTSHAFLLATADEFTGLTPSHTVDVTVSNSGSSTTAFTTTAVTTTGVGDLLYAAYGDQISALGTTYTAGSGFTAASTSHVFAGTNGRDLFTAYKTDVPAGSRTGTATASAAHLYAAVMVAYYASSVVGTATVELVGLAIVTPTFNVTATATVSLLAQTNAFPVTGFASLDLFSVATITPRFTVTAGAGLTLTALATPTQQHIPVETDLTFRISTDDLIVDAAIVTTDGVTSIAGKSGDTRITKTDTTVTADLTETSQLGGFEAGRSKARHLYRLRSKPRRNASTVSVNAAPLVAQWTVGSGSPTAYQAAIACRISDLIRLAIQPNGGGDLIVARYWIEGIRQQVSADGSQWLVTFNISRADENPSGGFFQFGVSAFGDGSALTW